MDTLLADRAIECVEVLGAADRKPVLQSPRHLGCKGTEDLRQVEISMGEDDEYSFLIRYNRNEVTAVHQSQLEFSIIALLSSLLLTIAATAVAFGVIIGRPLNSLLKSIEHSVQTGENAKVEKVPNDELGQVIGSFNDMQQRLSEDAAMLAEEVKQRRTTEEELRGANQRIETARSMLEDQFSQLEEQRNDMQTILDNMPHSVVWLDKDRNIRMRSKRVAEVHGMSEEEYQHVQTFYDHVRIVGRRGDLGYYDSEEELNALIHERVNLLANEQDIKRTIRIKFPTQDRCIQVRVAQLPDGGCILGQFDISDQVAIENELAKAHTELAEANTILEAKVDERTKDLVALQETLVESERQAMLGHLAAKLCHELRNPLSGLKLSLHVIKNKVGENPSLDKAFTRADRTLSRCTEILNDFYDFAVPIRHTPYNEDLCVLVENVCRDVANPDDVRLQIFLPKEEVRCNVDSDQLSRALDKILENAVQAVADKAERGDADCVRVEVRRAKNGVGLVISDTGVGMCAETAEQALEPLYSTRGFGVGLGMPIAVRTVERHGGKLKIESAEGEGTTVAIWLPLEQPERAAA